MGAHSQWSLHLWPFPYAMKLGSLRVRAQPSVPHAGPDLKEFTK